MQLIICLVFFLAVKLKVSECVSSTQTDSHGSANNGHVGKKGLSTTYTDNLEKTNSEDDCASGGSFETKGNYIIRTKDSKANGAIYISAVQARTHDSCLTQCCARGNCDTAVFTEGVDAFDSDQKNCFLFDCRPGGIYSPNLCQFTFHVGYISSVKGGFNDHTPAGPVKPKPTSPPPRPIPTQEIPAMPAPSDHDPATDPVVYPSCDNEEYFQCQSGQCINSRYICNSVLDCDDGSDEAICDNDEEDGDTNANGAEEIPVKQEETKPPAVVTVKPPPVIATTKPARTDNIKGSVEPALSAEGDDTEEVVLMRSEGGSGMPPASSAILPLVVGLVITICLLFMVGCRLRYMNHRLRYGRLKTSAHDADYLINGMYL